MSVIVTGNIVLGSPIGTPTNLYLEDLKDVDVTSPLTGQYLRYNGSISEWQNAFVNADVFTYLNTSMTASNGITLTPNSGSLTFAFGLTPGIVTPGTYKSITVDTYGRVTTGTNPTTLAGYGITDALNIAGGEMLGSITFPGTSGITVSGLPTPTGPTDGVNKLYADNLLNPFSWKQSVQAATTVNITLSGTQVIDGYSANIGDRILVKNQTNQTQNGIYIVQSGAWILANDSSLGSDLVGAVVLVGRGTTQFGTLWSQTTPAPITLGTSNIVWQEFQTGVTYSAGLGLQLIGTTFSNTGVLSAIAGTGIGLSNSTGNITFSNTGVTSAIAGSNISISSATGAVTISVTGTVPTSTNIAGGATNEIPYQSAASTTTFNSNFTYNNSTGILTIGGNEITLAGNLTTSGAFATTLNTIGTTSVTLPTNGTLLSTTSSAGSFPILNQNTTGNAATATVSTTSAITNSSSTNSNFYIPFVSNYATGDYGLNSATDLYFNPFTGNFTATVLNGVLNSAQINMTGPVFFNTGLVTATGTNQGSAAIISTDISVVNLGTGGVILPTLSATGRKISITNQTASPINVYPASGASIENLAINIPVSLPPDATISLFATSTGNWWTSQPVYNAGTGIAITQSANGTVTWSNTGAPATSGTSILSGNGSGGFSNVTVGSGLTFSGGTLSAIAGGSVTSVSVTSANGFNGTVATATTTPAITLSTTVTGLLKGNGTALLAAVSGTDYAPATSGISLLYGDGLGGFSNATIGSGLTFSSGTLSSSGGTVTSTSVVTANGFAGTVATATTTPAITLSTTITGLLKGNSTAISAAVSGTDYSTGTSSLATGLLKSTTGTGVLSIASSGTDYAPATSGTSILYGNGSGGFSNVTVGSGLTFSSGTLSAAGSGGTVTSVSVVSANGFAGTVATATTTPAITVTTSVTGILKGNGTSLSAASSGTDYSAGTSSLATGLLKSTTGTGVLSVAVSGTDYAPATSGTSILYGNGTGGFSNVTIGSGLAFSSGTLSATGGTFTLSSGSSVSGSSSSAITFEINGTNTNATMIQVASDATIPSSATTEVDYYRSVASTTASSFTLPTLIHYDARQGTFGVGSAVTSQYGFYADSTIASASNNYGFYGNITASANNWNLYMPGGAHNYLAGNLLVGTTIDNGTDNLQVNGTILATGVLKTNGSILTLAGNLTTSGAFATTLTATGTTSVTLPTSGTLLSTTSSAGSFPILNQNTTGNAATSTTTSNISLATTSANATYYIPFGNASSGSSVPLNTDTLLTFNPNTNVLSAPTFSGALSSSVTGTTQPYTDNSTKLATTAFNLTLLNASMSTVPLNGITGGTYNFATLGSGLTFTYHTNSGAIDSIGSVTAGGSGYAVGDLINAVGTSNGNQDAILRVTTVSGTAVTGLSILYGGTGYTGTSSAGAGATYDTTLATTYTLTGTLTSNATFIVPAGTRLFNSNQWIVNNNTTGAFTLSWFLSNGSGGTTGSGVVILQGTNNSTASYVQTDGVTDVWSTTHLLPSATTSQLFGGTGSAGSASVVSVGTGLTLTGGTLSLSSSAAVSWSNLTAPTTNNSVTATVDTSQTLLGHFDTSAGTHVSLLALGEDVASTKGSSPGNYASILQISNLASSTASPLVVNNLGQSLNAPTFRITNLGAVLFNLPSNTLTGTTGSAFSVTTGGGNASNVGGSFVVSTGGASGGGSGSVLFTVGNDSAAGAAGAISFTGGTSVGGGGSAISLIAGNDTAGGAGGSITATAGSSASGTPGSISLSTSSNSTNTTGTITIGTGANTGTGANGSGSLTISTGNTAGTLASGNINITAGNNNQVTSGGNGGNIILTPGTSTSGTAGTIQFAGVTTTANQMKSTLATGTAPFVVASTTQVANLNAATAGLATTATNIAGGAAGSIPYQTGSGATSLLATGSGVLVGGTTPSYSTAPILTGTNFTGIPNGALTNSSITIGSTNIALGATTASLAGLTSVASGTLALSATITSSSSTGALSYGTLGYSDTNIFESLQTNVNGYAQLIIQNTNSGTAASADIIVSNNNGTATTNYGNFGINSSGFTGTGSYGLANATYLSATTGDLSIGTTTANSIHLFVNTATTDSITIDGTTGNITLFGLTDAQNGTTSGSNVSITSGGGTTSTNTSGTVSISSGNSSSGKAGSVTLALGTSNVTGAINILTLTGSNNSSTGSGQGGKINITSGSAAGTATAGDLNLTAGANSSSGTGGTVNLSSGSSTSGSGGNVNIFSGNTNIPGYVQINVGNSNQNSAPQVVQINGSNNSNTGTSAAGGEVDIYGGASASTSAAGGIVRIIGGNTSTAAAGGAVIITGGQSTTGTGGGIQITSGNSFTSGGNSGSVTIQSNSAASGANSGVVALASGSVSGGGTSGNVSLVSGDSTSASGSGTLLLKTGTAQTTFTSGTITIQTGGNSAGSTGTSGSITLQTGATTSSTATGQLNIGTGNNSGTGNVGSVNITVGTCSTTSTPAGLFLTGSNNSSSTSGSGGSITMTAGSAAGTQNGGSVTIAGGANSQASSGGNGGNVTINGGNSTSGTTGQVNIGASNTSSVTISGTTSTTLTSPNSSTATTGTSALKTGNGTTQSSGAITIQSGTATGSGKSTGNIVIDVGAGTSSATNGTVGLGTTNATSVSIGNTTNTTTVALNTAPSATTSAPVTINGGNVEYVLAQTGITFVVPSSGTMGNNGALSAITALQTTFSGGAYFWFPTNAISSGSTAGWYWTVMSSTTAGTVYNSTYTSGVPVTGTTTAFATTGPGAYTQQTTVINGPTISVPANVMGKNGRFEFNILGANNNTANNKTYAMTFGGTSFWQFVPTTTTASSFRFGVANKNSLSSNVGFPGSSSSGFGGVSATLTYGTINTGSAQNAILTMQLATATDYILLDNFILKMIPG
jgi:hypothetical protein